MMDTREELIPERLNFVEGIVDSEDLTHISRGTLHQHKILRVITKNSVNKCRATRTRISEKKNEYMMFHEQRWDCLHSGFHVDLIKRAKIAELLLISTSKIWHFEDRFEKKYMRRMEQRQRDMLYTPSLRSFF